MCLISRGVTGKHETVLRPCPGSDGGEGYPGSSRAFQWPGQGSVGQDAGC